MLASSTKSNGMSAVAQSWRWTSESSHGFVPGMDDTADLIAALCTRIGMIMEDTSAVALAISGMNEHQRHNAISDIEAASERIAALVAAVWALHD